MPRPQLDKRVSCGEINMGVFVLCRLGDRCRGEGVEVQIVHLLHQTAGLWCFHVRDSTGPYKQRDGACNR